VAEEKIEGWLTEAYDYERPQRGQIRDGVILRVDEQGLTVDVGLKREGFVPRRDLDRLGEEAVAALKPGDDVTARIVKPEDREGNLLLSLFQARQEQDWRRAKELMDEGEVWRGKITGFNRGGLTVKYGHVYGFIPGSHLWSLRDRHLSSEQREAAFQEYVGQELSLAVIEVDRRRRRLILSERKARERLREQRMVALLEELTEGQICRGTVCRLCDFGAFVDLGGADGMIHVSELAWKRVRHPKEVLQVGEEVQVYVLRLDRQRKRIGLSLKRLQPDPWDLVDMTYDEGQLVLGRVSSIAKFGIFAALDVGVEGLVHVSELEDPPPEDPGSVAQVGDELVLRIMRLEPNRHRIGLSLRRVSAEERATWLAAHRPVAEGEPSGEPSDDGRALSDGQELPEDVADPAIEEEEQDAREVMAERSEQLVSATAG
jgi:small subunit ribosomal protein S1